MSRAFMWTERTLFDGRFQWVKDLLTNGSHTLEIWGCSADGWQAYLVRGDVGLPLSPVFHRDFGDTMRMLKEACQRVYGVTPKKGRDWNGAAQ